MTDSNVIRSTITKQPESTKFSNLESKAASKDEFLKSSTGLRRKIYEEGFDAYLTGKTNPYSGSGKKYWESGWHDAMRKDDEALEIESINAHNAMMDEPVDFDH
ncbi:hypothetical protein [Vibrio owensii]|uniref:hypothetical protein n=1 Tax=Vibrio owensii TaxID=696485 RepID=UPI00215C0051|nr:hypothetical protein [Vibrio owensii]MCR9941900.1 hypothetical protein [Vibrio owensii]